MKTISQWVDESRDIAAVGQAQARFTLRIRGTSAEMLKHVAAALDKSKTGCAEELLECAIGEAFEHLDMFFRLSDEELEACGFTRTPPEVAASPIPEPVKGGAVSQAREGSEVA